MTRCAIILAILIFSLNVSSEMLGDLHEVDRRTTKEFRDLAFAGKFAEAKALLKEKRRSVPLSPDPHFMLNDIFTAYWHADSQHLASFLTDFCSKAASNSPEGAQFYKKIVSTIGNSDEYHQLRTETPLSILAAKTPYWRRDGKQDDSNIPCIKTLLEYGANPLFALYNKGDWDLNPLSIALINHNVPVVEIFLDTINSLSLKLPHTTNELLRAYRGESFTSLARWGPHIHDLYRVANQAGNSRLVKKLSDSYPYFEQEEKKYKQGWEHEIKESLGKSFYYPPFWAMNVVQLKDYARKIAEQLKGHVIDKAKLKALDDTDTLFLYEHDGKSMVLRKKLGWPLTGRILCADHLSKHGRLVAQKFIVPPKEGLTNAKVTFTLPSHFFKTLDSGSGHNPINIEFKGIELYAENIEGEFERTYRSDGFIDNDRSNAIRSANDTKLYIIDTGDDKNCIIPLGNAEKAYEAKILNFAPHMKYVTIDLSKKHD